MSPRNLVHSTDNLGQSVQLLFGEGTGADAADLTAADGQDCSSIEQTATGEYTITLKTFPARLLHFSGQIVDAVVANAWHVVMVSESVATDGKILIQTLCEATTVDTVAAVKFAPADLSDGERLTFVAFVNP
jgi:hypothetical protein